MIFLAALFDRLRILFGNAKSCRRFQWTPSIGVKFLLLMRLLFLNKEENILFSGKNAGRKFRSIKLWSWSDVDSFHGIWLLLFNICFDAFVFVSRFQCRWWQHLFSVKCFHLFWVVVLMRWDWLWLIEFNRLSKWIDYPGWISFAS